MLGGLKRNIHQRIVEVQLLLPFLFISQPIEREMTIVERSTEEVKPPNMQETENTAPPTESDSRTIFQTDQTSVKEADSRTNMNHLAEPAVKETDDFKMAAKETDTKAAQHQSVKEADPEIKIYQTAEHPVKEIDSGTNIYQVKSTESDDRINEDQQEDISEGN